MRLICKRDGFSKQVGESGTPRLLGFICLWNKRRITEMNKIDGFERAMFRKARDLNALIAHCRRGNDYWEWSRPAAPVRIISTVKPWQAEVESLYLSEPTDHPVQ